ncbi:MAG: HEAT repeat domain-containing protein [Bacteriovoracaceae bacterium]
MSLVFYFQIAIASDVLLKEFKADPNKKSLDKLRSKVLKIGAPAVPSLITIMKSEEYPENSRWMATFLLGRIAGNKASPFIAKFLKHPNFLMRLASLKTLLILKEDKRGDEFSALLKDPSLIVRYQALDNIKTLKLSKEAPHVWAMMFDEQNYAGKKGARKRTNIIKKVVETVGELKYIPAKDKLVAMTKKSEYADIKSELNYSLAKMNR